LKNEKDQASREKLVQEVADRVNHLYYQGKDLGKQIDRARKALNG
jgi:hypothetical protein